MGGELRHFVGDVRYEPLTEGGCSALGVMEREAPSGGRRDEMTVLDRYMQPHTRAASGAPNFQGV